ncbi:hypothetical protein ElP_21110 [Tautonia plasticadhaerens]|uniref:Uncharacterized protein n=1 Tax=Tautonia plasticadhaerens TaxID=2527974 RepID=A0A518H055_9BACT|nr:hypothetical protein ElP_21110 [Tautonia plasticadhaerens]
MIMGRGRRVGPAALPCPALPCAESREPRAESQHRVDRSAPQPPTRHRPIRAPRPRSEPRRLRLGPDLGLEPEAGANSGARRPQSPVRRDGANPFRIAHFPTGERVAPDPRGAPGAHRPGSSRVPVPLASGRAPGDRSGPDGREPEEDRRGAPRRSEPISSSAMVGRGMGCVRTEGRTGGAPTASRPRLDRVPTGSLGSSIGGRGDGSGRASSPDGPPRCAARSEPISFVGYCFRIKTCVESGGCVVGAPTASRARTARTRPGVCSGRLALGPGRPVG